MQGGVRAGETWSKKLLNCSLTVSLLLHKWQLLTMRTACLILPHPTQYYTGFNCILPHPTRSYLILPHPTPYYTGFNCILPHPTRFYLILPHITLDSTASYLILPGPTLSYPILPHITLQMQGEKRNNTSNLR